MNKKKKIIISSYHYFFYIFFLLFLLILFLLLIIFFRFDFPKFPEIFKNKNCYVPKTAIEYCPSSLKYYNSKINILKSEEEEQKEKINSILKSFDNFKKDNIRKKILFFLKKNNIEFSDLNTINLKNLEKLIIQFINFQNISPKDKFFQDQQQQLKKNIDNFKENLNIKKDNYFTYSESFSEQEIYNKNYSNNSIQFSNCLSNFFNLTDTVIDNLNQTSYKVIKNTTSFLCPVVNSFIY
ncbi:hypothetical protein [Candidatus Phytoplasma oryzae]|nr:hypothetical protein PIE28_00490 [Candidatus Phytoplasma oryzae]